MPYKDPEKQKAAQRESAKRRRESIRVTVQRQRGDLIAYIHSKKQDPCMEFDHVRGEKVIGVGRMANQRFPITAIDEEIAKCDLVCANCHRLRHMK
jgi:peptide subunit release factor 1 (eRF1)